MACVRVAWVCRIVEYQRGDNGKKGNSVHYTVRVPSTEDIDIGFYAYHISHRGALSFRRASAPCVCWKSVANRRFSFSLSLVNCSCSRKNHGSLHFHLIHRMLCQWICQKNMQIAAIHARVWFHPKQIKYLINACRRHSTHTHTRQGLISGRLQAELCYFWQPAHNGEKWRRETVCPSDCWNAGNAPGFFT